MEVDFEVTKVFKYNLDAFLDRNIRTIVNRGGSSSSKSISIMQLLTVYAYKHPNTVITVVGATKPFLKKATIYDWKTIVMKDLFNDNLFNKSDLQYKFPNGSIMQFVSADVGESSLRGIRSTICYFDEINNQPEDVYTTLSIRTKKKIIVSFNPSAEFFITEQVKQGHKIKEIVSTYKDNRFLEQDIIEDLENKGAKDENFRRVMVLGEYGNLDGVIFQEGKHWELIDELPTSYDLDMWGMDFGFTNDPTTLIQCRIIGESIYIQEHLYKTNLLPRDIARITKEANIKNDKIIADNARPEIIAELKRVYGINIQGVKKPNILPSIDNLKQKKIFVTKDSLNAIKELRYYQWSEKKKDKYGKTIPNDNFNHIIDALRYVASTHFKPRNKKQIQVY